MDDTILQEADNIESQWQTYGGLWDAPVEGAPSPEERNEIRDRVLNLWRGATNWITLTELNRRFLQFRLPVCQSYGQPPEPETATFSNLLPLHNYGIITTNSCPGWVNRTHTIRQRAFLCFSIPTQGSRISPRAIYNFVQRLRQSSDVRAYIRFQYDGAPAWVQRDRYICGLMQYGSCDSLPDSADPVWDQEGWDVDLDDAGMVQSFTFVHEQRRQHAREDWTEYAQTLISTNGSSFLDEYDPLPASIAADPLQITVVARQWSYTGIQIGNLITGLLNQ